MIPKTNPFIDDFVDELRGSTPHDILGANIPEAEFHKRWAEIENSSPETTEKIAGACSRIQLIDAIQNDSRFSNPWEQIQSDALQVYLLCTCFDALAEKPVPSKNTKQRPEVGKNYYKLFTQLPNVLQRELIEMYAVIEEPKEKLDDWSSLKKDDRLKRVVDYLYQLRRNTFTHNAKISPTAKSDPYVEGVVCFIPKDFWIYSVYFLKLSKICGEVSLLRIIAIGKMREMLGFPIDQRFLDLHWKIEDYKQLFRRIYAELVQNERVSFNYLRNDIPDLIRQPRRAIPRLKNNAAETMQESQEIDLTWFGANNAWLRKTLSNYVSIIEQANLMIKQCEIELKDPTTSGESRVSSYEQIRQKMRDGQFQNLLIELTISLEAILNRAPQGI